MIRQGDRYQNLEYLAQTGQLSNKDIVYYNLSINAGLGSFAYNVPTYRRQDATFNEINQSEVLKGSSEFFISIMRATIPTLTIPRLLAPVIIGQTNINLMYNVFTLAYRDNTGAIIYAESLNCIFQSEILNPTPVSTGVFAYPKKPEIEQDLTGYYYYVYYVDTILKIFNTCLKNLYASFVSNIANAPYSISLPPDIEPFITYDNNSQLFSLNAESINFNQNTNPHIEIYADHLTENMLNLICKSTAQREYIANPAVAAAMEILLVVDNEYYNTKSYNANNYLVMTPDQSSLSTWGAFEKIVFEISSGISVQSEIDSIPVDYQQSTSQSFQKPNLTMLCDFEVDKESWSKNSQFIQFTAASMSQVRLISIESNNPVQNFVLSIYWVDNFGTRRLLNLPSLNPLTVKLAFFKKSLIKMI